MAPAAGAPRVSGALVVISDLHLTGMLGEFEALAMALTDRDGDGADNELVSDAEHDAIVQIAGALGSEPGADAPGAAAVSS